jgi:hypothetical protein
MNEAGLIVKDHWPWLLAGVATLVLIALVSVVGLILFTRWVVHLEFGRLTSSLHDDISALRAEIALIARTTWTDLALARKFADVDTVAGATTDGLYSSQESIRLLTDEQDALRATAKDHGERLQVLEAWKAKISDMTIIRSGF